MHSPGLFPTPLGLPQSRARAPPRPCAPQALLSATRLWVAPTPRVTPWAPPTQWRPSRALGSGASSHSSPWVPPWDPGPPRGTLHAQDGGGPRRPGQAGHEDTASCYRFYGCSEGVRGVRGAQALLSEAEWPRGGLPWGQLWVAPSASCWRPGLGAHHLPALTSPRQLPAQPWNVLVSQALRTAVPSWCPSGSVTHPSAVSC